MFDFVEKYFSEKTIKMLERAKVICWNNNKPEYLRIKKGDYTSFQVPGFITKIYYPPNSGRDYGISVYVHYIEYKLKKMIREKKLKIKTYEDYLKLYNSFCEKEGIPPEAERFYKNFKRRRDFNDARIAGKIGKGSKFPNGND